MDKKLIIGLALALGTGGLAIAVILAFKTVRKVKVKRERKQLKKYAKKYLKNNKKALEIIDNMSNFQVRILFKVFDKVVEEADKIKLPNALSDKLAGLVEK